MTNSNYKTAFFANETDIRIQLRPKAKNLKGFIQQIEVVFSIEGSTLQKVTLTDPTGDLTDIRFSNIVVNEKIDATAFTDF
jgi:outer membrane lipoprotein-sorting protein